MTTTNQKPAETSPVTHIAWKVEKRNGKTFWTRVGVAFQPHKDGKGFTVNITPGIAVMGEIVFREPKPEEVQPETVDDEVPF